MTPANIKAVSIRGISLFVAFAFTVTTLVGSPSQASAFSGTIDLMGGPKTRTDLHKDLYAMPEELGSLQRLDEGGRMAPAWPVGGDAARSGSSSSSINHPPSEPFVVLIQDAHANPEGQQNVAGMLQYLETKSPGLIVGLEGAVGELHPEYLNFFKEFPGANRAVIEDLEQKGELNGVERFLLQKSQKRPQTTDQRPETKSVEVFAAASSLKSLVSGVEDPGLYRDNLKTYRELLSRRDEIQTILVPIRAGLEKESSRKLNADLRAFLKERSRRKDGKFIVTGPAGNSDLLAYVRYLQKQSLKFLEVDLKDPIEQLRFPSFLRLVKIEEAQKGFDVEKAKSQWGEAVKTVKTAAKDPGEKEFGEALTVFAHALGYIQGAEGKIPAISTDRALYPRKLLEGLFRFGQRHQLSFAGQEAFWQSWKFAVFQAEINVADLFTEMNVLEEGLVWKLARSEEEKSLVRKLGSFDLLEKMLRLELSREEYGKVLLERSSIEDLFARSETSDPATEALAGRQGPATQSKNLSSQVSGLKSYYAAALHFYDVSLKRDEALVENLLNIQDGGGRMTDDAKTKTSSAVRHPSSRISVLYTGGFHTSGIEAILRQKGMGYAVLAPRITRTDHGEMYQKVMSGANADLSAYFKVKNPFLTKQEALFFKQILETAAPALSKNYQLNPSEVAARVSQAVKDHPVLSEVVDAGLAGQEGSSSVRFQPKPNLQALIPQNSSVMAEATLDNRSELRSLAGVKTPLGFKPMAFDFATGKVRSDLLGGEARYVDVARSEMRSKKSEARRKESVAGLEQTKKSKQAEEPLWREIRPGRFVVDQELAGCAKFVILYGGEIAKLVAQIDPNAPDFDDQWAAAINRVVRKHWEATIKKTIAYFVTREMVEAEKMTFEVLVGSNIKEFKDILSSQAKLREAALAKIYSIFKPSHIIFTPAALNPELNSQDVGVHEEHHRVWSEWVLQRPRDIASLTRLYADMIQFARGIPVEPAAQQLLRAHFKIKVSNSADMLRHSEKVYGRPITAEEFWVQITDDIRQDGFFSKIKENELASVPAILQLFFGKIFTEAETRNSALSSRMRQGYDLAIQQKEMAKIEAQKDKDAIRADLKTKRNRSEMREGRKKAKAEEVKAAAEAAEKARRARRQFLFRSGLVGGIVLVAGGAGAAWLMKKPAQSPEPLKNVNEPEEFLASFQMDSSIESTRKLFRLTADWLRQKGYPGMDVIENYLRYLNDQDHLQGITQQDLSYGLIGKYKDKSGKMIIVLNPERFNAYAQSALRVRSKSVFIEKIAATLVREAWGVHVLDNDQRSSLQDDINFWGEWADSYAFKSGALPYEPILGKTDAKQLLVFSGVLLNTIAGELYEKLHQVEFVKWAVSQGHYDAKEAESVVNAQGDAWLKQQYEDFHASLMKFIAAPDEEDLINSEFELVIDTYFTALRNAVKQGSLQDMTPNIHFFEEYLKFNEKLYKQTKGQVGLSPDLREKFTTQYSPGTQFTSDMFDMKYCRYLLKRILSDMREELDKVKTSRSEMRLQRGRFVHTEDELISTLEKDFNGSRSELFSGTVSLGLGDEWNIVACRFRHGSQDLVVSLEENVESIGSTSVKIRSWNSMFGVWRGHRFNVRESLAQWALPRDFFVKYGNSYFSDANDLIERIPGYSSKGETLEIIMPRFLAQFVSGETIRVAKTELLELANDIEERPDRIDIAKGSPHQFLPVFIIVGGMFSIVLISLGIHPGVILQEVLVAISPAAIGLTFMTGLGLMGVLFLFARDHFQRAAFHDKTAHALVEIAREASSIHSAEGKPDLMRWGLGFYKILSSLGGLKLTVKEKRRLTDLSLRGMRACFNALASDVSYQDAQNEIHNFETTFKNALFKQEREFKYDRHLGFFKQINPFGEDFIDLGMDEGRFNQKLIRSLNLRNLDGADLGELVRIMSALSRMSELPFYRTGDVGKTTSRGIQFATLMISRQLDSLVTANWAQTAAEAQDTILDEEVRRSEMRTGEAGGGRNECPDGFRKGDGRSKKRRS